MLWSTKKSICKFGSPSVKPQKQPWQFLSSEQQASQSAAVCHILIQSKQGYHSTTMSFTKKKGQGRNQLFQT